MTMMDWKKESSGDYIVYPAGTYKVRIVSYEYGESRDKKTPQIVWKAEIVEPEDNRGRTIMDYTYLTQTALWRIRKAVSSCGVDVTKLGSMDTNSPQFKVVLDACKERTVYWYVIEEMYKGKPRNKVNDYQQDPDQPVIEPPKPDEIEWT